MINSSRNERAADHRQIRTEEGVFAEFETAIRRERQAEGIAAAKAAGVYKGRPPSIKPDDVAALRAKGLGATEIAKRLKIGRASVYRVLEGV
jgi:DNA invertase Pin-like site-specific DNA recombinase